MGGAYSKGGGFWKEGATSNRTRYNKAVSVVVQASEYHCFLFPAHNLAARQKFQPEFKGAQSYFVHVLSDL